MELLQQKYLGNIVEDNLISLAGLTACILAAWMLDAISGWPR